MKLQTVPKKFRAAIRRGGISELWRVASDTLFTHLSPRGRRRLQHIARCDADFDRERGTDTAGMISPWDMGPTLGSCESAHGYEGTDASALRRVLEALSLDFPIFTFVDLGSGKARVLLVAAEYPFHSVVGIEHAVNLHMTAERNIRIDRGPRQCRDVRSLLGDVTEFSPPAGPLLVYLFNPFERSVFEQVLVNLQAAWNSEPREILILTYREQTECPSSMFTARGFACLSRIGEFSLFRAAGQT
jgi:hypothetical protein